MCLAAGISPHKKEISLHVPAQDSRRVWLFNSLDFSGNPKWLFLYVLAKRPDIEAYWIADNAAKAEIVRGLGYPVTTYADKKLMARAGVYVVNQVKERIPAELRDAVLLNLWHGVGVKLIERQMKESHLLPRIAEKYIRNNKHYRDAMMLLVTSPVMEKHFQAQIDPLPHQIIRADYPQNSVPRVLPDVATFDHDLRMRKGLDASTRIVAWVPTYRLVGNRGFVQRALPDMDRLIERLEETNQLLILKMHPQLLKDPSYQAFLTLYANNPRVMFWDNAEDFYEVFDQVDTAIIDYSSIHYDLLAGGVTKFIRYAFDIDEPGALEPGLDYDTMSVGTRVNDFDELVDALGRDNTVESSELERIDELFWAYRKDGGPEAIINAALSYEMGDVQLPTLYTFDIFDTVIHRRAVLPRSIFLALRDRLLREGDEWPAYFVRRFEEVRGQAESAVRESKRKDPRRQEAKDFEISLDEIYSLISEVYGIAPERADIIKQWEIELEIENVIPDPVIVEQIVALREAGETVVLVSDMYLPLETITAMVTRADARLAGLPIYLSSEIGVQKSTSALYARVFADIGYDFGEWIHTGDNNHADVKMAKRIGITPVELAPTKLDQLETSLLVQGYSHDIALITGLFRAKRVSGATRAELFAYRHLAGLLVPYVLWAVDDAVERGYETLYFVARDGHFLKIIADAYISTAGIDIKTRYIYGSRRAWRLASQVNGLNADVFAPHGLFGGVRDLGAVALQARVTTSELIDMVPELKPWAGRSGFSPQNAAAVISLLAGSREFHAHMLHLAADDNAVAQKYMRQEIDFDEKFAFVDYWGRGYTQDCLVDIFRSMGDVDPRVVFYYARSIYRSEGDSIRHNFTSAAYGLTLVELILANQPHGTTLAYVEDASGRVGPRYEPREYSAELLDATERMIAEFAVDVAQLPLHDRRGAMHEVFRFAFEHYRTSPSHPDYAEFLAPLRDSITMGDIEREFAPRLTMRDYLHYLKTKRSGDVTRSMSLSLSRSSAPVRMLAFVQRKVGLRRWRRRLKQAIRQRKAARRG